MSLNELQRGDEVRRGKRSISSNSKNMPSLVGVFGAVDCRYRPDIAAHIFGADALQQQREQQQQASCDVAAKLAQSKTRAAKPTEVKLHHPADAQEKPLQEPTTLVAQMLPEDAERVRNRLRELESRLAHHDRMIGLHEESKEDLTALRNCVIARKKNPARKLKDTQTLSAQRQLLDAKFSREDGLKLFDRNVLTCQRGAAICAGSFIGVAGVQASSKKDHPPQQKEQVRSSSSLKESWKQSVKAPVVDLLSDARVRTLPFHLPPSQRMYPRQSTHTIPPDAQDYEGSENKTTQLERRLAPVSATKPDVWLQSVATSLVKHYNDGVVFTAPAKPSTRE